MTLQHHSINLEIFLWLEHDTHRRERDDIPSLPPLASTVALFGAEMLPPCCLSYLARILQASLLGDFGFTWLRDWRIFVSFSCHSQRTHGQRYSREASTFAVRTTKAQVRDQLELTAGAGSLYPLAENGILLDKKESRSYSRSKNWYSGFNLTRQAPRP